MSITWSKNRSAQNATQSFELCVFGECDHSVTASILSSEFALHLEGPLQHQADFVLLEGSTMKDELKHAIKVSITQALWQPHRGTRIGDCAWLIGGDQLETGRYMISVTLSWMNPSAVESMIVTVTSSLRCSLHLASELDPPESERRLLLAPSGVAALRLSVTSGKWEAGVVGSSSQSGVGAAWQSAVSAALSAEGIDIGSEDEWIDVLVFEDQKITWPARLCYMDRAAVEHPWTIVSDCEQTWFAVPDEQKGYGIRQTDPLVEAEQWHNSADLRNHHLEPCAEVDANNAIANMLLEGSTMPADLQSPPLLLRPDNNPANYLYPTPPDGTAGLQITQHSDPVPTLQARDEADRMAQTGDRSNENHPQSTNDADIRPRGPSVVSSAGGAHGFGQHSDDLFGDMEQIGLGRDEIGDEDFSFFDQTDELAAIDPFAPADSDEIMSGMHESNRMSSPIAVFGMAAAELSPALSLQAPDANAATTLEEPNALVLSRNGSRSAIDALPGTTESAQHNITVVEHKPLSPLTIREQLLPPPIPASALRVTYDGHDARRPSSFGPLTFKQNQVDGLAQEPVRLLSGSGSARASLSNDSAQLAPTSMRESLGRPVNTGDHDDQKSDTPMSSGRDSSSVGSSSPVYDEQYLPRVIDVSVASRKRKREGPFDLPTVGEEPSDWISSLPMFNQTHSGQYDQVDLYRRVQELLDPRSTAVNPLPSGVMPPSESDGTHDFWTTCNDIDRVMIAQVLAEQALTTTRSIVRELQTFCLDDQAANMHIPSSASDIITDLLPIILPSIEDCDMEALVLARELPARPAQIPSSAAKPPGQPRPPPTRIDTTIPAGPDVQSLLPPYMRATRAGDSMELLPTAMQFWDALGLGPVSASKDVRFYCVAPLIADLEDVFEGFLQELGRAYEGCNLGLHRSAGAKDDESFADRREWFRGVPYDGHVQGVGETWSGMLKQYVEVCLHLGEQIAADALAEPDTTAVVYIVEPFTTEPDKSRPVLCAAFNSTYMTCVRLLAQMSEAGQNARFASDLVLQILPIDMICKPQEIVVPTSAHMMALAREVYDRLPPGPVSRAAAEASGIPAVFAPCVHLAPSVPKRVNFQLSADPPQNLLHEGSLLHMAYCFSIDRLWLLASWVDATGVFIDNVAYSMRGRTVTEIFEQAWERTLLTIERRQVAWKVCITHCSRTASVLDWEARCWIDVISEKTKRKQVTSVTLLAVDLDPTVQFSRSFNTGTAPNGTSVGNAGFLTPVSTPRGGSLATATPASTTVASPSTEANTAPPTPAPSDSLTSVLEKDPDAHLVDLEDESWSLLLNTNIVPRQNTLNNAPAAPILASGLLLKCRNPNSTAHSHLPALGADLLWTVQVRASVGGIVEGNARHAEQMLREMLGTWKGLGTLAKLRGLSLGNGGGSLEGLVGLVPIHVIAAIEGAKALDEMPK